MKFIAFCITVITCVMLVCDSREQIAREETRSIQLRCEAWVKASLMSREGGVIILGERDDSCEPEGAADSAAEEQTMPLPLPGAMPGTRITTDL